MDEGSIDLYDFNREVKRGMRWSHGMIDLPRNSSDVDKAIFEGESLD